MNIISNLILFTLLGSAVNDLREDSFALSESVAEDRSEAAAYGDGPVGSWGRERQLYLVEAELDVYYEWISSFYIPVEVVDAVVDELPF